jgi:membrane protease YdiL (CAAX protease family)
VNFCLLCGTRVEGAYCSQCGASTELESYRVAEPLDAPDDGSAGPMKSTFDSPMITGVSGSAEIHTPTPQENRPHVPVAGLPQGAARRSLVRETRWVMVAFLVPVVTSAVLVLAEHASGVQDIARFPTLVHHEPVENMLLGILGYLPVASTVPLGLYLLARTGQDRRTLGLALPRFKDDILVGLGIGIVAFLCEVALLIPFASVIADHKSLFVDVSVHAVPKYYLIWGIAISAVTAVTEEVMVNGYLITRLGQLGWTPRASLTLSLILRTSYHVYYGFGFLLTVPLGFIVTRSFQKRHKLTRPIVAHFLFDAVLITISILR